MAFGRKKKGEPLSRYDRQEEGFLDDEEQELYTRTGADFSDAGYGVRDSYSRQLPARGRKMFSPFRQVRGNSPLPDKSGTAPCNLLCSTLPPPGLQDPPPWRHPGRIRRPGKKRRV